MALVPVQIAPGISKSGSDYASGRVRGQSGGLEVQGRYTDGNHVRFSAGFPEKIGGWQAFSTTAMTGIPRAEKTWLASGGTPLVGIGTTNHLYKYDGTTLTDISPLRTISTGTLGANPLATSSGSTTVAVTDASQNLQNGDWVKFTGASVFNGVTIVGWYMVANRSAGGFDITAGTTASGTGSGGGAAVMWAYPRVTLAANPFATVSGDATVTVTHTAHGATTGDYAIFSGASAVAGLTISGEYPVTVTGANAYTIEASGNANATTTGGGAAVSVIYIVTMSTFSVSSPIVYGSGSYGAGIYGYGAASYAVSNAGWTLDSYGNQLIGAPIGGTIYVHKTAEGGRAHELLNAPTNIQAMFVTPERFVVALGTASSGMTMAWADQDDYTNWTSGPTNTANSGRTKQGGSKFVAGAPVRDGVSVALSNKAAFLMNYTGDNSVYATPEISDNAGCISPWAIAVFGENAYWMGQDDFWVWDGGVRRLPSDDIRDYVFRSMNKLYGGKCWAGVLRAKNEIWFSYPSDGATEIDRYVVYHIDQPGVWSIGEWSELAGSGVRTAWVDADLFDKPIAADASGILYRHEVGTDDDGEALEADLEFAPVDISNGDANVDVFGFIADFKRLTGDVTLTVSTRQYPNDTPTTAAFTVEDGNATPVLDFRLDAKLAGFEIESNAVGGDFRLGVPRFNLQGGGARL